MKKAFLLLGLFFLTACVSGGSRPVSLTDLSFMPAEKIILDVKRIEIASAYQPSFMPPNIEHLVPLAPEKAIRQWVESRFEATGTAQRVARFVIHDAGIIERHEPPARGLDGTDHYRSSMHITLTISDLMNRMLADVDVSAWQEHAMPESTSLDVREESWSTLVSKNVRTLDEQIRQNLEGKIAPYIAP